MLEEICRLRATLGRVVFLWVPFHVGISPNSMVDAVAKTYLTQPPDAAGWRGSRRQCARGRAYTRRDRAVASHPRYATEGRGVVR